MRILVEATWEEDTEEETEENRFKKGQFWLHYWGLEYSIVDTGDGKLAVANWTVGICENYSTGEIRCFLPEQLRVIGKKLNDIKT